MSAARLFAAAWFGHAGRATHPVRQGAALLCRRMPTPYCRVMSFCPPPASPEGASPRRVSLLAVGIVDPALTGLVLLTEPFGPLLCLGLGVCGADPPPKAALSALRKRVTTGAHRL